MTTFFLSFSGIAMVIVIVLMTFTAVGNFRTRRHRAAQSAIMGPSREARAKEIVALERQIADKATEIRAIADQTDAIELAPGGVAPERPRTERITDTQLVKIIAGKVETVKRMAAGEDR